MKIKLFIVDHELLTAKQSKNTCHGTLILTGRSLPGPPSGVKRGGWVWGNPGDTGLLPELWSTETERDFQKRKPAVKVIWLCVWVAYCGWWADPCLTRQVTEACAPRWVWLRVNVGEEAGWRSQGWWKDWWEVDHTAEEVEEKMAASEMERSTEEEEAGIKRQCTSFPAQLQLWTWILHRQLRSERKLFFYTLKARRIQRAACQNVHWIDT